MALLLQGPKTDPLAVDKLRAAIKREETVTVQLLNYRKDGTHFLNQITMTPIRDRSGRVLQVRKPFPDTFNQSAMLSKVPAC